MGQRVSQAKHGVEGTPAKSVCKLTEACLLELYSHIFIMCVCAGMFNHPGAQIRARHLETGLCQGDGMHPRAAGCIENSLSACFLQLAFQERHFHCEPPRPVDKTIII